MRKILISVTCIMWSTFVSFAQESEDRFHFGFIVELGLSRGEANPLIESPVFEDISVGNSMVGSIGNSFYYQFTSQLAARGLLGITFSEDRFIFINQNNTQESVAWLPFSIFTSFHGVINPLQSNQFFLVGGASIYHDISNSRNDQPSQISLKRFDFSLDVGFGFPIILLRKIKFLPELRYSFGLLNLNRSLNTNESRFLRSYNRNKVSIILGFLEEK